MTKIGKDKNEILPVVQDARDVVVSGENSPAQILQIALDQNMDLDRIEKMLEFQERWEKNEARKAYHSAMAQFKLNPPEILKDKHVHFNTAKGPTDYNHATIGNVVSSIIKRLAECEIYHSWETEQKENGKIVVTCKLTHCLGYSESVWLESPPDPSGGKNNVQAIASAVTYLQRYTLLSITGLATHDQDDDGQQSEEIEYINLDQATEIKDMIKEKDIEEETFLRWLGAQKHVINIVEEIPANYYDRAIGGLKAKK